MNKLSGAQLIVDERQRQREVEGWTPERDDQYSDSQLIKSAVCYTVFAGLPNMERDNDDVRAVIVEDGWPWDKSWWKPGPDNSTDSRILELKKAGALLAAEIDRLLRIKEKEDN